MWLSFIFLFSVISKVSKGQLCSSITLDSSEPLGEYSIYNNELAIDTTRVSYKISNNSPSTDFQQISTSTKLLASNESSCIEDCTITLGTYIDVNQGNEHTILHFDADSSYYIPPNYVKDGNTSDFICARYKGFCGATVPVYRYYKIESTGVYHAYSFDGTPIDGYFQEAFPICYAWSNTNSTSSIVQFSLQTCTSQAYAIPVNSPTLVDLNVYDNQANGVERDHWYTTKQVGDVDLIGYTKVETLGKVLTSAKNTTCICLVKLFQVFDNQTGMFHRIDHKLTNDETNQPYEQYSETGEVIYCAKKENDCGATLPLYKYFQFYDIDTVYTTDDEPVPLSFRNPSDPLCYIWSSSYNGNIVVAPTVGGQTAPPIVSSTALPSTISATPSTVSVWGTSPQTPSTISVWGTTSNPPSTVSVWGTTYKPASTISVWGTTSKPPSTVSIWATTSKPPSTASVWGTTAKPVSTVTTIKPTTRHLSTISVWGTTSKPHSTVTVHGTTIKPNTSTISSTHHSLSDVESVTLSLIDSEPKTTTTASVSMITGPLFHLISETTTPSDIVTIKEGAEAKLPIAIPIEKEETEEKESVSNSTESAIEQDETSSAHSVIDKALNAGGNLIELATNDSSIDDDDKIETVTISSNLTGSGGGVIESVANAGSAMIKSVKASLTSIGLISADETEETTTISTEVNSTLEKESSLVETSTGVLIESLSQAAALINETSELEIAIEPTGEMPIVPVKPSSSSKKDHANLVETSTPSPSSVLSSISEGAGNLFNSAKNSASTIIDSLTSSSNSSSPSNVTNSSSSSPGNIINSATNAISQGASSMIGSVSETAGNLVDTAKNTFTNGASSMITTLSNVTNTTSGLVGTYSKSLKNTENMSESEILKASSGIYTLSNNGNSTGSVYDLLEEVVTSTEETVSSDP